jgi:hypothetical protein
MRCLIHTCVATYFFMGVLFIALLQSLAWALLHEYVPPVNEESRTGARGVLRYPGKCSHRLLRLLVCESHGWRHEIATRKPTHV